MLAPEKDVSHAGVQLTSDRGQGGIEKGGGALCSPPHIMTMVKNVMMKIEDKILMKAIAICFKQYLKPHEAMIYCSLEHSHFARKCEEYGIYKNANGYFKKDDLDLILSGAPPLSMNDRLRALNRHRASVKK